MGLEQRELLPQSKGKWRRQDDIGCAGRQYDLGGNRLRCVNPDLAERMIHLAQTSQDCFDAAGHSRAVADQPDAVHSENHRAASSVCRRRATSWITGEIVT